MPFEIFGGRFLGRREVLAFRLFYLTHLVNLRVDLRVSTISESEHFVSHEEKSYLC